MLGEGEIKEGQERPTRCPVRLAQEGCTAQTLLPSPALPGRQLCPFSLPSVTPGLYPGHGEFCVSGWEGLQGSPIPSPPSSPAVDCCLSFPDGWRNGSQLELWAWRVERVRRMLTSRVRNLLTLQSLPLLPGQGRPAPEKASWDMWALG